MTKLKTIKLQGRDYVQVHTRVEEFHRLYKKGCITTDCEIAGDTVQFKASVVPDTDSPVRVFTGHSFGKLGKEKALEKLETVSVGRALAFLGIGIVEGLASADEMQKFQKSKDDVGEKIAVTAEQQEQIDMALAGELICASCAKEIKFSKNGNLYCPGAYDKSDTRDHSNYTKKPNSQEEIPTIDTEGEEIPF